MLTKDEQDIFYKKLGVSIRIARKNDGNKKQETLANELGLTRTSLVNIEHGNQKIQLHVLLDLVRILKIDLNEVLPQINVNHSSSGLNKQLEAVISNKIQGEINNLDDTMKIVEDLIKQAKNNK